MDMLMAQRMVDDSEPWVPPWDAPSVKRTVQQSAVSAMHWVSNLV